TIAMQMAANRSAQDINQLTANAANTPEGKRLQMQKQYENLKLQFGLAVLPMAIKGVELLGHALRAMADFARAHPAITKGLIIAFTSLASLMVVGGSVTLITASFRALGLSLAVGKGVGLGKMLLDAAGGIGALSANIGMLLAKGGLVAGAGGVGYMAGKLLNSAGPEGDLGGWFGGKL